MCSIRRAARTAVLAGCVVACGLLLLPGCSPLGDDRPNIVLFIADDQSYKSLSPAAPEWFETPNLDRIAAEGVRFANSFVTTSLCSPARASFLTGQYVRTHGIIDNFSPFPARFTTFASELTRAGYDTTYLGKWHMGPQPGRRPGFRHSASFAGQGAARDNPFYVDGELRPTVGYIDDVSTQFALEFLDRPRDGPFLLVLGFKAPHTPRVPPPHLRSRYTGEPVAAPSNLQARTPFPTRPEQLALAEAAGVAPGEFEPPDDWAEDFDRSAFDASTEEREESERNYYRMISAIDENVGRVLDQLDVLGLAEDTIVVYVSDNGLLRYSHAVATAGKRSAYEESMRIPTLFRYPRLDVSGRTIDDIILNIDLAPTLLDFAGVPIPDAVQGESWRRLLVGDSEGWRQDFVYEYYPTESRAFLPETLAIRTHSHKLVLYTGRPAWTQLFDLRKDPFEMSNLAGDPAHRERLARLRARLAELEAQLGPRYGRSAERASEGRESGWYLRQEP